MPQCLIGLGSNLGDRRGWLDSALVRLEARPGIRVLRKSPFHETRPVGGPAAQGDYLNAAAVLETSLSPRALLAELQGIEAELGRRRVERWEPRTADLDLLLYDRLVVDELDLAVPHPRMAWRRFVLEPANEIAPEMVHARAGWTVARLWQHLNQTPWYMALAGPIGVGKSSLALEIAEKSGARLLAETFDSARLAAFYRNPSSHAWQTEIEFLEQRACQLASDQPAWNRRDRPAVSDFWFAQSAAFARVWLDAGQLPAYMARWTELENAAVRPRLLVLLSAPLDTLLARIQARGRAGEETLTVERLRQIEGALQQQATKAGGPLLRLDAMDAAAARVELLAALEAMQ